MIRPEERDGLVATPRTGRLALAGEPGLSDCRRWTALAWILWVLGMCAGCNGCGDSTGESQGDAAPTPAASADDEDGFVTAFDMIDQLPGCDADHRGVLLDMGADALLGAYGWNLGAPSGVVASRYEGATWARIYDRKVDLTFATPATTPVFVAMRAVGRDARTATLSIDGQLMGTLRLSRGEVTIRSTRTTKLPLEAGLHQLRLRFRGRKKQGADPFAEIDWIRIGVPDEVERTYGAPTQLDLLAASAKLAGVPHRAIALRAPGSVRCTLRIPPEAQFRAAVGIRGTGSAKVAVKLRTDGDAPKVLQWTEVQGGDSASWTNLRLPLSDHEAQIGALELALTEAHGTGRLLIGDPKVVVPAEEARKTARAKTVVIVVLNGVERDDLPPWRNTVTPHLPTLSMLSESATVFDAHRAPSSLVSATVASLISGVSPRTHQLYDAGARLPDSVQTLGRLARDASVRAAMFTGVPTTFKVFGFAGQWEPFGEYPRTAGGWLRLRSTTPSSGSEKLRRRR